MQHSYLNLQSFCRPMTSSLLGTTCLFHLSHFRCMEWYHSGLDLYFSMTCQDVHHLMVYWPSGYPSCELLFNSFANFSIELHFSCWFTRALYIFWISPLWERQSQREGKWQLSSLLCGFFFECLKLYVDKEKLFDTIQVVHFFLNEYSILWLV